MGKISQHNNFSLFHAKNCHLSAVFHDSTYSLEQKKDLVSWNNACNTILNSVQQDLQKKHLFKNDNFSIQKEVQ